MEAKEKYVILMDGEYYVKTMMKVVMYECSPDINKAKVFASESEAIAEAKENEIEHYEIVKL